MSFFSDCFSTLRYHFKRTWKALKEEEQKMVVPEIRQTIAELPPEVRALFAAEIKAAEKAAKEANA